MAENVMEGRAAVSQADLTNASLTDWEDRIGKEMRISNLFNQLASYEAIRNYANGIGDINPLYRDEEYASKSPYGALIAHPAWFVSVFPH